MLMRRTIAILFGLAATTGVGVAALEFQVVRVNSVPGFAIDQLKPNTIIFNDQRTDDAASNGFVRFDDWSRLKPFQKQYLSLYRPIRSPLFTRSSTGSRKPSGTRCSFTWSRRASSCRGRRPRSI